jgi:hypothetical protein
VARTRWTDDRLDDLGKIVLDNDQRLDKVQAMSTKAADDIEEMLKRDALSSRSRWERYAIAAALCSPILTAILHFLPNGHS